MAKKQAGSTGQDDQMNKDSANQHGGKKKKKKKPFGVQSKSAIGKGKNGTVGTVGTKEETDPFAVVASGEDSWDEQTDYSFEDTRQLVQEALNKKYSNGSNSSYVSAPYFVFKIFPLKEVNVA